MATEVSDIGAHLRQNTRDRSRQCSCYRRAAFPLALAGPWRCAGAIGPGRGRDAVGHQRLVMITPTVFITPSVFGLMSAPAKVAGAHTNAAAISLIWSVCRPSCAAISSTH